MKNLFFGFVVLFSLQGLAQPQVCYRSENKVSQNLSAEFCLSDLALYNDGDHQWLEIFGGNLAGQYTVETKIYGDQEVAYVIRKQVVNLDGVACTELEQANLVVEIPMMYGGGISSNLKDLNVFVEYFYMRDSCHTLGEETVIPYTLVK